MVLADEVAQGGAARRWRRGTTRGPQERAERFDGVEVERPGALRPVQGHDAAPPLVVVSLPPPETRGPAPREGGGTASSGATK
ncbi:hypothetical protein GCM10012280_29860 [Wenjunlia tyrosinilytica]|uniref:Uncharacterized protein n=1 Tax=Wenjunlia tyrosinilytica TaxID=1544741 RepID=A0A918DYR3_9ACTN|nr:hypothetical protein GCM10012280_29860 [Wenjunlia tyrosinilytica]